MKKFTAIILLLAGILLFWMPAARTSQNGEAEIRQLLDRWAKAARNKDLAGIMSIYEPGEELVAYDIVPPLQYTGYEAYKKDYQEFLDQFQWPIDVAYPNVRLIASATGAFRP